METGGLGLAINICFNGDEFTLGVGIGAGIKMSYINTYIKQSISLTDAESDVADDISDVGTEVWMVINSRAVTDDKGNITGYEAEVGTRNTKGAVLNTGIKI